MAQKMQNLQQDSPWLTRPTRPDGTGRTEREHVPVASLEPRPERLGKMRERLVQILARRAVEILAENSDEQQKGHLRPLQQP